MTLILRRSAYVLAAAGLLLALGTAGCAQSIYTPSSSELINGSVPGAAPVGGGSGSNSGGLGGTNNGMH